MKLKVLMACLDRVLIWRSVAEVSVAHRPTAGLIKF
jgi:hypothetical protein